MFVFSLNQDPRRLAKFSKFKVLLETKLLYDTNVLIHANEVVTPEIVQETWNHIKQADCLYSTIRLHFDGICISLMETLKTQHIGVRSFYVNFIDSLLRNNHIYHLAPTYGTVSQ